MYCPKCNKENPDDVQVCQFCNASITDTSEPKQPVTVGTSKIAIASFVCTLCGLLCFLPVIIAAIEYRILSPKSDLVMAASGLSLIAMGAAIILGVTALALIGSSGPASILSATASATTGMCRAGCHFDWKHNISFARVQAD